MYRFALTIITLLMLGGCVQQEGPIGVHEIRRDNTYVDLESGKRLMLRFDSTTGYVVEQNTNRRVNYFVDEATMDTINARGKVINNKVIRKADGSYSEKEDD